MAYQRLVDFQKEYERAVQREKSRTMNFMGAMNVPAKTAWDLYQNARKPGLKFHIFGRHVDNEERWKKEGGIDLASKQPRALGKIPHPTAPGRTLSAMEYNFGIVNDATDGSILMMGGQNWNLHVNDAWVMGGVHAYLPFYSASELKASNIFRDRGTVLGITGREFLGLLLAGYKKEAGHEALGVMMVCKNRSAADALDFSLYEKSVEEIEVAKSRTTVVNMADKAGIKLA